MAGERRDAGDIVLAAALAVAAAIAFRTMPPASPVRLALALLALLFVPGYLALQVVFVPPRPARSRVVHALVAVAVSPAIVALAALVTGVVPGGFRPAAIVVMVTAASLGLAVVAHARRVHAAHEAERARSPAPVAPPSRPELLEGSPAGARPAAPEDALRPNEAGMMAPGDAERAPAAQGRSGP